jgi:hypothetical protein
MRFSRILNTKARDTLERLITRVVLQTRRLLLVVATISNQLFDALAPCKNAHGNVGAFDYMLCER